MGGVWEIIGWIGSGIVVVSMMQQRITRLRLVNLVGCLVSLAYSVAIGAWPLAGLNAALSTIQIYHLVKLWRTRDDARTYQAVVTDPQAEIVDYLLERHGSEIRGFFPAFRGPEDSTNAFVVMNGDEVVGLVLATREGDVAELDVDFVLPAYRDFTPGQFVFGRSSVWQETGVRKVRTAVGGPDYYERIGFTKVAGTLGEDPRFELAIQ
ncbi:MAG TPA: YgjV family protein [Actinomycetales bacterium]|nr:YgjV family protein [Actinomycetales bacterium]